MDISEAQGGTSEYGNYLPSVFSVCHSPEWWMDAGANVHISTDISLFSSYQEGSTRALLTGNGSHARVLGVGTVILKFTLEKTVLMKNMQHVPSNKNNLVNGSQLCRDGYKIIFKANKVILSKFGTFIGKGYDYGDLFRSSMLDVYNKVVNYIIISNESNIWYSRFCHVNFSCLTWLANMNLIPKFNLVKRFKCHVCMQSKQPHKPHKATDARNLAPLQLIYFNLC